MKRFPRLMFSIKYFLMVAHKVFILFVFVDLLLATDEALSQADVLNKILFDGSS